MLRRVAGARDVEAFGADAPALEREWRARLLDMPVPPATEARVRRRLGLPAERLADGADDGAVERVREPPDGDGWIRRGGRRWTLEGDRLFGDGTEGPGTLRARTAPGRDGLLGVRVRRGAGARLTLRLHADDTDSDDVLLGPEDIALTAGGGADGFLRTPVRVAEDRWTEVHVLCEGTAVRVYVDRWLVLSSPDAFRDRPGTAGLTVDGGRVEVASFRTADGGSGAR